MIPIKFQTATCTTINPFTERHRLAVSTARAVLRRIGGVYRNVSSTGTCSLAEEDRGKLSPRSVLDTLGETAVMHHLVDREVFDSDHVEAIDYPSALLVREVVTAESDAFMDTSNWFAALRPFRRSLRLFRKASLHLRQRLFVSPEESWIGDPLTCGERCEVGEANVNAHRLGRLRRCLIRNGFAGKGDVPFARAGALDTARLDAPLNGSMEHRSHTTDLRQGDATIFRINPPPTLWVGKRIVAPNSTKPWVARGLPCLHATEEGFHPKVNAGSNILQDLAVNTPQRWVLCFYRAKGPLLIVQAERLLSFFPSRFSLFQEMVVQPATFAKRPLHKCRLMLSRIQPVLEGFTHMPIIAQKAVG